MNKKGLTAIVDAMFFMVLIMMAAGLMTNIFSAETQQMESNLSEAGDLIFTSSMKTKELGYSDPSVMNLVDLAALSLMDDDDKAGKYISDILGHTYSWENAFYLEIAYGHHTYYHGIRSDGWSDSYDKQFDVQYGGQLSVRILLYY